MCWGVVKHSFFVVLVVFLFLLCFCFVCFCCFAVFIFLLISCLIGRKEGNVLFNNTLNTFYLQLYGVGHMVKDHSESKRKKLTDATTNGYYFRLAASVLLYDRIAHTTAFIKPVTEHWPEQEIVQWAHHEGSIQQPITPRAYALPWSYISLLDAKDPVTRYVIYRCIEMTLALGKHWHVMCISGWIEKELNIVKIR